MVWGQTPPWGLDRGGGHQPTLPGAAPPPPGWGTPPNLKLFPKKWSVLCAETHTWASDPPPGALKKAWVRCWTREGGVDPWFLFETF